MMTDTEIINLEINGKFLFHCNTHLCSNLLETKYKVLKDSKEKKKCFVSTASAAFQTTQVNYCHKDDLNFFFILHLIMKQLI